MDLKYDLETNVNLVSFERNRIKISFNENLKPDFVKILTSRLLEWTGERWIITLTSEKGNLSKKEIKNKKKETLLNQFLNTKEFSKIKKLFDDVSLKDVED